MCVCTRRLLTVFLSASRCVVSERERQPPLQLMTRRAAPSCAARRFLPRRSTADRIIMPGDGSILLKKRLCPDPPVPPSFSLPMGTGGFTSLTDAWAQQRAGGGGGAAGGGSGALASAAPSLLGRAPLGDARESSAAKARSLLLPAAGAEQQTAGAAGSQAASPGSKDSTAALAAGGRIVRRKGRSFSYGLESAIVHSPPPPRAPQFGAVGGRTEAVAASEAAIGQAIAEALCRRVKRAESRVCG